MLIVITAIQLFISCTVATYTWRLGITQGRVYDHISAVRAERQQHPEEVADVVSPVLLREALHGIQQADYGFMYCALVMLGATVITILQIWLVLDLACCVRTQKSAPPNDGPATPLRNSGSPESHHR